MHPAYIQLVVLNVPRGGGGGGPTGLWNIPKKTKKLLLPLSNIVTPSHHSFLESLLFYKFYNSSSFSLSDSELLMSLFLLSRSHDQLFYCPKFRTNMSLTPDQLFDCLKFRTNMRSTTSPFNCQSWRWGWFSSAVISALLREVLMRRLPKWATMKMGSRAKKMTKRAKDLNLMRQTDQLDSLSLLGKLQMEG